MTGDETWLYHFEPESKGASLEWYYQISPKTKKIKTEQSAGKMIDFNCVLVCLKANIDRVYFKKDQNYMYP